MRIICMSAYVSLDNDKFLKIIIKIVFSTQAKLILAIMQKMVLPSPPKDSLDLPHTLTSRNTNVGKCVNFKRFKASRQMEACIFVHIYTWTWWQKTYKEYLIAKCADRGDSWANEIRGRLETSVSDLHAMGARHHRDPVPQGRRDDCVFNWLSVPS